MALNYLWDTNTVIYYLQDQLSSSAEKYLEDILSTSKTSISVITKMELLCWNTNDTEQLDVIHKFISAINVIGLEDKIITETPQIRKQHKIKLPDAIIASTALIYDLTLITRNVKDFKAIAGLEVFNPFSSLTR